MKNNTKVILTALIIVALIGAGIVYFRSDLFQTKPVDDRKVVNQVKNVDGTSAKIIGIYSSRADLHLHKSSNGQMQAKINGKIPKQDKVELKWSKQGKGIYLKVYYLENDMKTEREKEKQAFPDELSLDVFIPSKVYDSIEMSTHDGNVTSDIPLQASEMKVDTQEGSVNLTNISGDQVQFKSDEGNIQLKKVNAGYMTLTSWEGNISLTDSVGQVNGESHSGNINITRYNGSMILKSSTGNIKAEQIAPVYTSDEITTDSGNVDFAFQTLPTNLYLALTSESGSLKNSLPTKKMIDKDKDYYHIRYIKGTLGNGTGNVVIDTKSGNIHVSLKK
ncbi:DUF4097 domain-containing protein [Shimazuella sp. AN120528]|uniref:DUF4097 family beta strand repeat-containing protein n=1 Tax=Shimazuella soli TaxID=1892854 RepID=UPI001F0F35B2|nr:DUF4097 family beta strand repeat-containing protein [Shimazuella soli]MCH5586121.1 DUF4097 domain-containing protein [Shimazuella soli]